MDKVTISTSIKYGNYKRFLSRANEQAEFVKTVMPYARQLLTLPPLLGITVRPIRGRVNGTCNRFLKIEMETRRKSMGDFLITLMHELVHAEQFFTGRLATGNRWNGVEYKRGTTYKKYRELPWEVEAWDRQEQLAKDVLGLMHKDGLNILEHEYKNS